MKIGYACGRDIRPNRQTPTLVNAWACPQLATKLHIDVVIRCANQEVEWYQRYGDKLL